MNDEKAYDAYLDLMKNKVHKVTIEGVKVIALPKIPDERGTIMRMLRKTDPHFIEFGEIYWTTIYAGAIKGWHKHREMTLNYAVPVGMIKLVLYDEREGSPTKGNIMELFIGEDNYCLVQVPPNVWNGSKAIKFSILANCCTHVINDPSRTTRLDPYNNHIPYDWKRKDC